MSDAAAAPSGAPAASPPAAPLPVTIADVRAAAAAIGGAVARSPVVSAPSLASLSGAAEVVLKLETLHPTGSFKERGALNLLASLGPAQRRAGVIAMSAGNHAQGVAYHARRLGIPATIVMPEGTPFTKVENTEALGATVLVRGAGLTEARQAALALAAERGLTFLHPYDDPHIVAGQGTVGLELIEDRPDLDAIVVPVGGGGLLAGVAVAATALKPRIEIVGAETALYPSMHDALRGGGLDDPPAVGRGSNKSRVGGQTIAEGIAVKEPGELTRAIAAALVSDIVLLDERELEAAIALVVETQHLVVEGAGAAPVAALLKSPERFRGRRVGLILSGANIDARLLASVLMRGLVRAGRLVRLRLEVSDHPGNLARVTGLIGEKGGNIVEVQHQRLFHDVPAKAAELDVVIETRNPAHVGAIVAALEAVGFPTRLLSNLAADPTAD
jgi:threonine dehydratase